jgi:hypothetical protein
MKKWFAMAVLALAGAWWAVGLDGLVEAACKLKSSVGGLAESADRVREAAESEVSIAALEEEVRSAEASLAEMQSARDEVEMAQAEDLGRLHDAMHTIVSSRSAVTNAELSLAEFLVDSAEIELESLAEDERQVQVEREEAVRALRAGLVRRARELLRRAPRPADGSAPVEPWPMAQSD